MHFDQRTQRAFREAGVDRETLEAVSEAIAEAAREDANRLESFFAAHDVVYSDMDRAHTADAYPEHAVEYCDLFTHADDIRGYLRFDTWGVPVQGGRVLVGDGTPEVVELTLGPTVHDRIRFAPSREQL